MTGTSISAMGSFLELLPLTGLSRCYGLDGVQMNSAYIRWFCSVGYSKFPSFLFSAAHFGRAIVMPNLRPPITTTAAAVSYRESIVRALPADSSFEPLMTLYLTDSTQPDEIKLASIWADFLFFESVVCVLLLVLWQSWWKCAGKSGVVFAVKLYPAGATTNSQDGVTDLFGKCLPVLEEMARQSMPLLVTEMFRTSVT